MKNFIKRLLGTAGNKTTTGEKLQKLIKSEQSLNKVELSDSLPAQKAYDVSKIKKQSTVIKNEQGYLASINFVKDFISSEDVELKEFVSLMKKTLPYMLNAKSFSNEDIIQYLKESLDQFPESRNIEAVTHIADLYHRVDIATALNYLEAEVGAYDSCQKNSSEHFEALIQLSDYYLENKQGNQAFITTRRAGAVATNIYDRYDYINKQKTLAQKQSLICLNGQSKPNYGNYLYFEILSFFLTVAEYANIFPHLHSLFELKNECLSDGLHLGENKSFKKALISLGIEDQREIILHDLYTFAFTEIPTSMGIPKHLLDKAEYEKLSKYNRETMEGYEQYRELIALSMRLKDEPFHITPLTDGIKKVMDKYVSR